MIKLNLAKRCTLILASLLARFSVLCPWAKGRTSAAAESSASQLKATQNLFGQRGRPLSRPTVRQFVRRPPEGNPDEMWTMIGDGGAEFDYGATLSAVFH